MLSALTVFAWLQRNLALRRKEEAERQTRIARSEQLAGRVLNIPAEQGLQRLLVSALATRYSHTAAGDARLGEALLPTVPLRMVLWSPFRDERMRCISFHRGGEWVAGSNTNGVTVWNVSTGRVQAYRPDEDGVDCGGFGPDEGRLAIADEGRVIVWDWRSGQERVLGGERNGKAALAALSDDGKTAYVASAGRLTQWDLESGRATVLVDAPAGDYATAFSPDAKRFAQSDPDQKIQVWDVSNPEPIAMLDGPKTSGLKLAFSSDGKTLAAGGVQGAVPVWDLEPDGAREVNRLEEAGTQSLAFSPDGNTLVLGGVEAGIRQWDFRKRSQRWPLATPAGTGAVAYHPAGRLLAASGERGALRLYEPARQHDHILREHEQDQEPQAEAFSSDGRMLVLRRGRGYFLWDPSGRRPETEAEAFPSAVDRIAFSRRGRLMAALLKDNTIGLWDSETGQRLPPLAEKGFWPRRFDLSPTDSAVAAIDLDGKLVVWPLPSRRSWSQDPDKTGQASSLVFTADGTQLVTVGLEGALGLWNVADGTRARDPESWPAAAIALAVSGNGRRLAASAGEAITIWETDKAWKVQRSLRGHKSPVTSLAFSADHRILASGGLDNSAIVWDVESGEVILKLEDRAVPVPVLGVAFSADGKLLATRGQSTVVRLWNVDSARWTEMACSILNRNLTPAEWELYLPSQKDTGIPACPSVPAGIEGAVAR